MKSIPYHSRIVIPEDVLIQNLDGEAVLLNLKSELYFGLDDAGLSMWQALTTMPSIQKAYDVLLAEYDVTPEKLKHDLNELLNELIKHGLIDIRYD
jgi:hypothetical protein